MPARGIGSHSEATCVRHGVSAALQRRGCNHRGMRTSIDHWSRNRLRFCHLVRYLVSLMALSMLFAARHRDPRRKRGARESQVALLHKRAHSFLRRSAALVLGERHCVTQPTDDGQLNAGAGDGQARWPRAPPHARGFPFQPTILGGGCQGQRVARLCLARQTSVKVVFEIGMVAHVHELLHFHKFVTCGSCGGHGGRGTVLSREKAAGRVGHDGRRQSWQSSACDGVSFRTGVGRRSVLRAPSGMTMRARG